MTEVYRSNLRDVEGMIAASCHKVGRDPSEVSVIGVTKTVEATEVVPLLRAGIRHFGENRWQQAKPKFEVPESDEAVWHFIGHLQLNKVKYVVPKFSWIHSVDTVDLGQAISLQAQKLGITVNCLIQVNVSGEASKSGAPFAAVEDLIRTLHTLPGLNIRGLMTMAPKVSSAEETRPVFRELAQLSSYLRDKFSIATLNELSMGMSGDFTIAVEEGATMVRIGRRLMEAAR